MEDLARKRAVVERVLKDSVTVEASVCRALARPRLCPLIQEYHLCTVDSIGLHRSHSQTRNKYECNVCLCTLTNKLILEKIGLVGGLEEDYNTQK